MRTPLHEEHIRLGARMVPFAGWEMPLLYRGIIPEHRHTRQKASIFDICHMGEFEVSGPSAASDLERLLTQSVASIPAGGCAYGYLLDAEGGVRDDLICYRFGELTAGRFGASTWLSAGAPCDSAGSTALLRHRSGQVTTGQGKLTAGRLGGESFWLVVNAATAAADAQWIQSHLSARTVFRDLSAETAKLDIQGPLAREEIERALKIKLPELEYYRFQRLVIEGVACLLSRTGYTGEFGYELYLPAPQAARFWKLFLKESAILPAGLGARDTLRVEMGYPLYGHELSRDRIPALVGRGRFMDLKKSFIGREAVLREMENPALKALVGLQLEGRMAARAGDAILEGERVIGEVTSGLFAPSLEVAVALGYIERALADRGRKLGVKSRDKILPAAVVKLPFYKNGTARQNLSG